MLSIESENTSDDTLFYRAFEDKNLRSCELINIRLLHQYFPFLEPLADLHPSRLDLGCGRDKWLHVTSKTGLSARRINPLIRIHTHLHKARLVLGAARRNTCFAGNNLMPVDDLVVLPRKMRSNQFTALIY